MLVESFFKDWNDDDVKKRVVVVSLTKCAYLLDEVTYTINHFASKIEPKIELLVFRFFLWHYFQMMSSFELFWTISKRVMRSCCLFLFGYNEYKDLLVALIFFGHSVIVQSIFMNERYKCYSELFSIIVIKLLLYW